MKILLIEDSPDARLLLHQILRDAGYRDTLSASSAPDAFKYLDLEHAGAGAKEIDLIVMDVRMLRSTESRHAVASRRSRPCAISRSS
jgi:CheY-like chemotaxis protein